MLSDDDRLLKEKVKAVESEIVQTMTYLDQVSRTSPINPFIVRWKEMRPALHKLAEAAIKEKKKAPIAINLLNKATDGIFASMPTMQIGFKVIPPGGRSLRPVQTLAESIEYVMEGDGYSIVDGDRLDWEKGDMFVVPPGAVHEHCNLDSKPAITFYANNGGLLRLMNLSETQPVAWEAEDNPDEILPSDPICWEALRKLQDPNVEAVPALRMQRPSAAKPFIVKWQASRELLEALLHHPAKEDPRAGKIVAYINRSKGDRYATAGTMVGGFQIIKAEYRGMAHCHSMAAIQLAVVGRGYSVIDGHRYDWDEGDVLIFPAWCMHEHGNEDTEPAILYGVLDNPLTRGMRVQRVVELEQGYQEVLEAVA